jgi:hypothetical protein
VAWQFISLFSNASIEGFYLELDFPSSNFGVAEFGSRGNLQPGF